MQTGILSDSYAKLRLVPNSIIRISTHTSKETDVQPLRLRLIVAPASKATHPCMSTVQTRGRFETAATRYIFAVESVSKKLVEAKVKQAILSSVQAITNLRIVVVLCGHLVRLNEHLCT